MPKIPSLPPISTLANDDEFPVEDTSASTTKRSTLTKLKEWLQGLSGWITYAMIATNTLRSDRRDTSNWLNISRQYGYRTSNQTSTSASYTLLALNSPSSNFTVSHTTITGRVKIYLSIPAGASANNMQIGVSHDGGTTFTELLDFSINDGTMKFGMATRTGLTANTAYTFGVYMKIAGGATATFYAFRSATLVIEDY